MLTQRIHRGETILDISAHVSLMASQSERGKWHVVRPDRCDCRGFQHRKACRHISIAFPSVEACERCNSLTDVVTDSRFIIGIGQVEETRCRDLLACDVRAAAGDPEDPSTLVAFTPPTKDPTLRGLYTPRP